MMKLLALGLTTLLTALPVSPVSPVQSALTITFLANEGVLLSSGADKVLIDALFLKYETGYAVPAESTQTGLARARPPFDADLVLATHRHGDHFHPAPMAEHLRTNPRAVLVTSQQVIDSLRSVFRPGPAVASRIASRTMAPGTRRRMLVNGISLELLGLPHGGRRHRHVEHLGYIVELGGRRVLHVGDAELSEATLAPFRLDTARIDVALLPAWLVTDRESREVIRRWIRPRQVVAFHMAEDADADDAREVQTAWPGAIAFMRSLDSRTW